MLMNNGFPPTVWGDGIEYETEPTEPQITAAYLLKIENAIDHLYGYEKWQDLQSGGIPRINTKAVILTGSGIGVVWIYRAATRPTNNTTTTSGTAFAITGDKSGNQWEALKESIDVDFNGAKGDGVIDDAIPLADTFNLSGEIRLGAKTYKSTLAQIIGQDVHSIRGQGWRRGARGNYSGSILSFTSVDGLLLTSTNPKKRSTTDIWNAGLHHFLIDHKGTGIALTIDNVIMTNLNNVAIECNKLASTGLHIKNQGYFTTANNLRIFRAKNYGIILEGTGSEYTLNQGQVSISGASSDSAIQCYSQGLVVNGGQYNVSNSGKGVGIRWYNKGATHKKYGSASDVICETDIAYEIDGLTKEFQNIEINRPKMTLTKGKTLIKFGRARYCVVRNPMLTNTTGTLALFGAKSRLCGLVIGRKAAYAAANITVDPSSFGCWVTITEQIDIATRDAIASYNNLSVFCDDVKGLGECRRINGIWDKGYKLSILDNSAVTIPVPQNLSGNGKEFINGVTANIVCQGKPSASASIAISDAINEPIELIASASNAEIISTKGTLSGMKGTDGKVTYRYDHANRLLYIENRIGIVISVKYTFDSFG